MCCISHNNINITRVFCSATIATYNFHRCGWVTKFFKYICQYRFETNNFFTRNSLLDGLVIFQSDFLLVIEFILIFSQLSNRSDTFINKCLCFFWTNSINICKEEHGVFLLLLNSVEFTCIQIFLKLRQNSFSNTLQIFNLVE